MAKYRILSLDGGGSWALLQVMALQAIYTDATKGHELLKDFDLVAANSGGSITLGGLVENLTLKDLLLSYFLDENKRRQIFSPIGLLENLEDKIYDFIGIAPRYSTAKKLEGLQALMPGYGQTPLPALPGRIIQSAGRSPHFIVIAFDYDRKRAQIIRSNIKSAAASFGPVPDYTLVEAIHASSTAPVRYFDAPAKLGGNRYWDGAIAGYNNPVLAAVTEALGNNVPREDIQVLSIGTGSVRLPATGNAEYPVLLQPVGAPGPKRDVGELAESILDDPPDAATFIAHVALGQPLPDPNRFSTTCGSIVRLNPMIQPVQKTDGTWALPPGLSLDEFSALVSLGMDAVAQDQVIKVRNLGLAWTSDRIPNQPIRSSSGNFHCEIGDQTFSQGANRWDAFLKDNSEG